jgi:hypothetical protein
LEFLVLLRATYECASKDFASVLSMQCARRNLTGLAGFENVPAITKFQDELTFEDKELSTELVGVHFG